MSLIQIQQLSFSYYGYEKEVFSHVSFSFDTAWKTGLIGRNGTGKSTLFRLLAGEEEYEGKIEKSVTCLKFPPEIEDDRQNALEIFYHQMPWMEEWKFFRELQLLHLEEELVRRPFSTLSKGQQTKVLLAMLFTTEDGFLLIDEPTNHLDAQGRKAVAQYLQSKRGFLLISHDRDFLDRCVDHIIAFNRSTIDVQAGNFTSWYENKQKRDQFERNEDEKLKKDIHRLKEAARQSKQWSDRVEKSKTGQKVSGVKPDKGYIGHQSAKMMQKAKNLQKRQERAISEKELLRKDIEVVESLYLPTLSHGKRTLVKGKGLCVNYGDRKVLDNLDIEILQGDRIALCGENGSGKSTLLKLLAGEEIAHCGELTFAQGLTIAYLPQETAHLKGSLKTYLNKGQVRESLCKAILRKLDFERELFDLDMEYYSQGQKKKVLLAVNLSTPAHLFLWDEPLNYMDVISRIQIEEMIVQSSPTMVFVEHDQVFTDKIATKKIDLKKSSL